MRVECAWCGKNMRLKGEETDDVSHTICLQCIEELLCEAGEEAERESWALAFKVERMYSTLKQDCDGRFRKRFRRNKSAPASRERQDRLEDCDDG